ncbi:MAG: hypothetical protein A3F11_00380 [Gammaproteobacteria bacterium RIFCSPHIGHO2_12_FULL_37_14]|nr:MAG: hypothetical protein A3F11_00380 [Gammaproteobacteria bacterium RIFCSPHIGHO2_12_FULL_37_14]
MPIEILFAGRANADNKSDISSPLDRGENLSAMEPLALSESSVYRKKLMDLALDLATKSAGLSRSLPVAIQQSLATLVRALPVPYM